MENASWHWTMWCVEETDDSRMGAFPEAVWEKFDRVEAVLDEPDLVANAGLLTVASLTVRLERLIRVVTIIHLTNQRSIACPHQRFTPDRVGGNTPRPSKRQGAISRAGTAGLPKPSASPRAHQQWQGGEVLDHGLGDIPSIRPPNPFSRRTTRLRFDVDQRLVSFSPRSLTSCNVECGRTPCGPVRPPFRHHLVCECSRVWGDSYGCTGLPTWVMLPMIFLMADRGLWANLLGATVGGIVEYTALVTGYRRLAAAVASLHGLAFLTGWRHISGSTGRLPPSRFSRRTGVRTDCLLS